MNKVEKNLNLALCNVQPLKNKENILLHELLMEKVDICAITETWLEDSTEDVVWCKSCLNTNAYEMESINRKHKRGGGLAIIWNSCKMEKLGEKRSFEYTVY